jgi:hypothetical protein
MKNQDCLPRNHEALHKQAKQIMDYLTASANVARLGFAGVTPLYFAIR